MIDRGRDARNRRRRDDRRPASPGRPRDERRRRTRRSAATAVRWRGSFRAYGQEIVIAGAIVVLFVVVGVDQSALPRRQQPQHHLLRQCLHRGRRDRHVDGHHHRPYRRLGRRADRRARHDLRHAGGLGLSDLGRLDRAGPRRHRDQRRGRRAGRLWPHPLDRRDARHAVDPAGRPRSASPAAPGSTTCRRTSSSPSSGCSASRRRSGSWSS